MLTAIDEQRPDPWPEWVRWGIGLALAAVVAYYTSHAESESARTRLEEREQNHYAELKAAIDLLRQDIRDLRRTP